MFRKWLLRDPAPSASARLFALPYLGAGASMFHNWPRWLGNVEVCPVQPPGRENRITEPAAPSYDAFVADMVSSLSAILDRPYAFFGHCASGYLALEAGALAARTLGRAPKLIFISSMFAPHEAQRAPILDFDTERIWALAEQLVKERHGIEDPDLIEMAGEAMSEDLEAFRAYACRCTAKHASTPLCSIVLIGWDQDKLVPAACLDAWQLDARNVDKLVLPGDHWSFVSAPPALRVVLATFLDG